MGRRLQFLIPLLLVIGSFQCASAQKSQHEQNTGSHFSLKDRLFVGGGLGASFGDITQINVSPQVGVRITNKFSTGIGGIYEYYKDSRYTPDYETSIYGGNVFARYAILDAIFLTTDFRVLNLETLEPSDEGFRTTRVNVPVWFLGGGFRQSLGTSRSSLYISIMYDVIQHINSPYGNRPFISVGAAIGI